MKRIRHEALILACLEKHGQCTTTYVRGYVGCDRVPDPCDSLWGEVRRSLEELRDRGDVRGGPHIWSLRITEEDKKAGLT